MRILILLAALAVPIWGAYTRIAHTIQTNSGINTPAIDTTGSDLIIVAISYQAGAVGVAIYDHIGGFSNTYTLAATTSSASSVTEIYHADNPTHVGAGHTFTCNGASAYCQIYVSAYSGLGSGGGLDLTGAGFSNTATTIQPGTITPTCTKELMISSLTTGTSSTPSVSGASVTDSSSLVSGTSWGGGIADLIETSAASFAPTWNVGVSAANASISVSFKANDSVCSGGGGGQIHHRVIGGEE